MKPAFDIVPMFIGFFIVAGLGQELGWTGFLLPRLQARFGALTSCVIRAILVGIWHLPLFIYSRLQLPQLADFPYAGWIAQKGFLVAFGVTIIWFSFPWSVFFCWIFNNTKGSFIGSNSSWVRNLGCLLDDACWDQPKQPGQLLGIWCNHGPDCHPYRHHNRLAKPVTQTQKDYSPAIAWIGNSERIHRQIRKQKNRK